MKKMLILPVVFMLSGCGDSQEVEGGKNIREPMPLFSLPGIDGNIYSLSDFKGKVVIVDFWATWCPPCRQEIPVLISLYSKYKKRGLEILGIGLDNEYALQEFSRSMGINYPVLIGTKEIARRFGIRGIPTTYVVDKNGKIGKKFIGFAPSMEKDFRNIIERLLNE